MKKLLSVIAISIFFFSCRDRKLPNDILDPKPMQAVLSDVLQADVFTNMYVRKDSTKNLLLENAKLQLQIFTQHKTERNIFYKSLNYYKLHPELMTVVLDSLVKQSEAKKIISPEPKRLMQEKL